MTDSILLGERERHPEVVQLAGGDSGQRNPGESQRKAMLERKSRNTTTVCHGPRTLQEWKKSNLFISLSFPWNTCFSHPRPSFFPGVNYKVSAQWLVESFGGKKNKNKKTLYLVSPQVTPNEIISLVTLAPTLLHKSWKWDLPFSRIVCPEAESWVPPFPWQFPLQYRGMEGS